MNNPELHNVLKHIPEITDKQVVEIVDMVENHITREDLDATKADISVAIAKVQGNLDDHRRETREKFVEVSENFVEVNKNFVEVRESIAKLETVIEKNAAQNNKDIANLKTIIESNAAQNSKEMSNFQSKIMDVIANQNRTMITMSGIIVAGLSTVMVLIGTQLLS